MNALCRSRCKGRARSNPGTSLADSSIVLRFAVRQVLSVDEGGWGYSGYAGNDTEVNPGRKPEARNPKSESSPNARMTKGWPNALFGHSSIGSLVIDSDFGFRVSGFSPGFSSL